MKLLFSVLTLSVLLMMCGCASQSQQANAIPMPTSTPFDSDQMARMAYLEGYRQGYRAVAAGTVGGFDMISGSYRFARELGWRAGASQAQSQRSAPPPSLQVQ
jgi:hypothetical protein